MQKRTKGTIRDTICFYQTAGHRLEEILHVYWNDYPDHSHYRFARRVLWHRRRTVLRHRLLWRWRPRPHRRYPADPAIAGKDLIRAKIGGLQQIFPPKLLIFCSRGGRQAVCLSLDLAAALRFFFDQGLMLKRALRACLLS